MKPLIHPSHPSLSGCAVAGLIALAASGCVTTEDTLVLGNPTAPLTFGGYASAPGATVELYAFDRSTDDWEPKPLATTIADNTPFTYGGRTIYSWNLTTTLIDNDDPSSLCRLSPRCTLAESSIRVQFREVDGDHNPLLTFDKGGITCTAKKVNDGADLYAAAWECKGEIFDELSIPVIL
ncbi:hypothetical protein ENSA5_57570 [Enhygromyxa salina]|uniref:Lipoprotein n=1 Tax=Enhygromyxa salina TaxID=215803 RepID=A0A2S9XE99_9BACT|nr:hypothetical protein [Enhygromyxa salina]PRP91185.1 hypothetical protein ENSA5_57570 [Enhygromyxa salina]